VSEPGGLLGCGEAQVYLYDRGARQRLYRFEAGAVLDLEWARVLSDTSTATLEVDARLCDCNWLGMMRAARHELVIYRDDDRVWEGPVTRIAYSPTNVQIVAKDVSWWLRRRALDAFFRTGNVVDLGVALIQQALLYDDPNVRPWLVANNIKGEQFTAAYNRADGYYIDALDDLVESGMDWTVIGRRFVLWASVNKIAQTTMLRTPEDLAAQITVYEDGESIATRAFFTGSNTWGAAMLTGSDTLPAIAEQDPLVDNLASNPSLRVDTTGFDPYTTRFFTVTRATSGWASAAGGTYGKVGVKIPAAGSDAMGDYNGYEMVLSMQKQAIPVAEGQLVSATLLVRPAGVSLTDVKNPTNLTLSWRGKKADGTIDDRGFIEGVPTKMEAGKDALLTITGVVPEDIVSAWVEVARDTSVEWKNAADGFWFDRFSIWKGRIEPWFDGDSTDTADSVYSWLGSTGQSQSRRRWRNSTPPAPQTFPTETQYQKRISDYYGIIDHIDDSRSGTTRAEMEVEAKSTVMRSFPAPLGIDIPQDAPLLPTAPVTINELMPGTIIPIQLQSTCRQVGATPILGIVKCSYTPEGEQINVTLTTSQAWEIDPPVDPDIPDPGEDDSGEDITDPDP
jgi:hypothetical protein